MTYATLGFTGTRQGMAPVQRAALRACLVGTKMLVHGACLGADAEADEIAASMGIPRSLYPSDIASMQMVLRDPKDYAFVYLPAPPLLRNKWMVRSCEVLFAAPRGPETTHSGTWATVRFARTLRHIGIVVAYPDGRVVVETSP